MRGIASEGFVRRYRTLNIEKVKIAKVDLVMHPMKPAIEMVGPGDLR